MSPDTIRKLWGLTTLGAAPLALLSASPALAQTVNPGPILNAAPLAIALGGGAFGVLALILLKRVRRDVEEQSRQAGEQIAGLRAIVDDYEAMLSAGGEVTVLWSEASVSPRLFGQPNALLPPGASGRAIIDFAAWLRPEDAHRIALALERLRRDGHGFDLDAQTLDARPVHAFGWITGNGVALRLHLREPIPVAPETKTFGGDMEGTRAVLSLFNRPAFIRDADKELVYINQSYADLAQRLGRSSSAKPADAMVELVDAGNLSRHWDNLKHTDRPCVTSLTLPQVGRMELVEFPIIGGTAGYMRPALDTLAVSPAVQEIAPITGIIDALATPIAIFDANQELVHFNRAYCALWGLDPLWLKSGVDEPTILDKLRAEGLLPPEADYKAWRAKHLQSYGLKKPRDDDAWHLPDGRTINVISAPAGPQGGVIYAFEDISERLKLESQNKAVLSVQRETLNALSEGVAVFGTNGRLTLSNPRLSALWKLPMNELGKSPHIDQIAEACGKALPEDGAIIWRDLKRRIIDLNPTRTDTTGRITRADGRLLDYAVTRLPDGQTMMTFLDVTESANYQRVLKERNDALITADRLKDAFVQNVSYELRSPLTNIIGFADLLASEDVGPLNERQRAYTDYIRASSVTLGVLIDNILDLATVDAGIAELRPEPQDVVALVDKARAGLAATFPEVNGEQPIDLVVDIAPNLPAFFADGTRIVQVLYNLLSNAARFSEPGGQIRLSVLARGERMVFIVDDDGVGPSDELRAALLDTTDPSAMTGRQRGEGLGLAIVKTFVNLHGGTLNVEKREPRGTRVTVNLPLDAGYAAGAAE